MAKRCYKLNLLFKVTRIFLIKVTAVFNKYTLISLNTFYGLARYHISNESHCYYSVFTSEAEKRAQKSIHCTSFNNQGIKIILYSTTFFKLI